MKILERRLSDAGYSVLREPILVANAETAFSAADLESGFWNLYNDNGTLDPPSLCVNVALFDRVRIKFYGTDAANEDGTCYLYGAYDSGPVIHLGSPVVTLGAGGMAAGTDSDAPGWHAEGHAHRSVKDYFSSSTAYLQADTITDVQVEGAASDLTVITSTDFGSYLDLDLATSQYQYLIALMNPNTAASLGAVYIPTKLKGGYGSIAGAA